MMYSKLSFAFENSHEQNYVTEKVWQPLKMGAIPIMRSPLHSRYLLPCPDSAIYVEDFDSVELLSKYLREVTLNETLWLKHTAWKLKNFRMVSAKLRGIRWSVCLVEFVKLIR